MALNGGGKGEDDNTSDEGRTAAHEADTPTCKLCESTILQLHVHGCSDGVGLQFYEDNVVLELEEGSRGLTT